MSLLDARQFRPFQGFERTADGLRVLVALKQSGDFGTGETLGCGPQAAVDFIRDGISDSRTEDVLR